MEIISRAEAKALKLKYYYTGKFCKRDHLCIRLVSSRNCVECDEHRKLQKGFKKANNLRRRTFRYLKRLEHKQAYYSQDLHHMKLFIIEHPFVRKCSYVGKYLGVTRFVVYRLYKELNIIRKRIPDNYRG